MNKLFDEIPRIENDRILLRRLAKDDIPCLNQMTSDEKVYRYLPTFLFEKQYDDSETLSTT